LAIGRRFWFGEVLAAAILSLSFLVAPVYGESQSQSGEITVTGVVPAVKYVYVDSHMNILRIISNAPFDAEPVFITDSSPPQKISPTPELLEHYQTIKAGNNFMRMGTVYDRSLYQMTAIGLQGSLSLAALDPSATIAVASAPPPSAQLLSFAD
jgi:hypothetical protein